jgi:hypothetical protein
MPWQEFQFLVAQPAKPKDPFRWWIDLLLLDEVVGMLVDRQEWPIGSWHVHRRAERTPPNEKSGHIFLFACIAPADHALEIDKAIGMNGALKFLQDNHLVERPQFNARREEAPEHDLLGERYWDPLLRRAWPCFVGGASETLLLLTRRALKESGYKVPPQGWASADLEYVEALYWQAHGRLAALWAAHWRYLVHHVRALLGYPPPDVELVTLVSQLACL